MKTIVLAIIFAISNFIAHAQEQKGVDILVTINNVKNDNGFVLLGLHDQSTFMNNKTTAIQNLKEKITDGKINVTFKNVPKGEFAIMVLHDENGNNKMDFELNGMPKEAYGMSNNEMSFGPPLFSDAKFTVKEEDIALEIRL